MYDIMYIAIAVDGERIELHRAFADEVKISQTTANSLSLALNRLFANGNVERNDVILGEFGTLWFWWWEITLDKGKHHG